MKDQHHKFCLSTLQWTNVYSLIIRNDVRLNGSVHYRRLYNESEHFRNSNEHFTYDESVLANTGFRGEGEPIIFPLKRNQCRNY